jgi:hypothetical protein
MFLAIFQKFIRVEPHPLHWTLKLYSVIYPTYTFRTDAGIGHCLTLTTATLKINIMYPGDGRKVETCYTKNLQLITIICSGFVDGISYI